MCLVEALANLGSRGLTRVDIKRKRSVGEGEPVVRIEPDRLRVGSDRSLHILDIVPCNVSFPASQIRIERRRVVRPAQLDLRRELPEQAHLEGTRDRICNVGLQLQHIAQVPVVSLRPQVKSRNRIDELRGDTHGVARTPHTALEYGAHIQLVRHGGNVRVLTLKGEGGGARRDL